MKGAGITGGYSAGQPEKIGCPALFVVGRKPPAVSVVLKSFSYAKKEVLLWYNGRGLPTASQYQRRNQVEIRLDVSGLAHTKWECKSHTVFAPKYRRQIIYGKIKKDIGQMLRKLCEYKGIEIIEAEACKDHIHMLISVPPKYSAAQIIGYLKGKRSLMIYEKYAKLEYKYGNRHFGCREYYMSTVGRSNRAIYQKSVTGKYCRRPNEYYRV